MSYKSKFKENWDLSVLFLAIYNSVGIPLELAFYKSDNYYLMVFSNFIDLVFFIDLIIMFFTSYRNKMGSEVWDRKEISINYMGSIRFLMDLIALLGSDFLT